MIFGDVTRTSSSTEILESIRIGWPAESECPIESPNILLLTYGSCRFDVLKAARTPVLDSYAEVRKATSPATYTYPAHLSFFAGQLPNCEEDEPYFNRFNRQLIALAGVGETNVARDAFIQVESDENIVGGLSQIGYQTVGAGAMSWFGLDPLTRGFERFAHTGTDADAQIDFLLAEITDDRPFFGFVNFGETHAPFAFAGKTDRCPVDVRARRMTWPPAPGQEPVGRESPAFDHQVQAVEFLDARLPRLFSRLRDDTIVVLTADHGECFGEGGYWGHGIDHYQVRTVPLAIFRLDGAPMETR